MLQYLPVALLCQAGPPVCAGLLHSYPMTIAESVDYQTGKAIVDLSFMSEVHASALQPGYVRLCVLE